jgi:amidase
MTKSVMGAAMMMNAMATATPGVDYTANLNPAALGGVRVGVLRFALGNNANIRNQFEAALKELAAAGAILVDIEDRPASPDGLGRYAYDILTFEFKDGLNKYLAGTDPARVPARTLAEVIEFNKAHAEVELGLFDQSIFITSEAKGSLQNEDYTKAIAVVQKASREDGIDFLMTEHEVQVLVAPSGVLASNIDPVNGDVWPNSWPGYGSPAARAGYPHATVPMGAFRNMPVGISFIGTANQDAEILGYAYAFEQQSKLRVTPKYLPKAQDDADVARMMKPYQAE